MPPTPATPPDIPRLLRRSTTWLPEAWGMPRPVMAEARRLAGQASFSVGRRDAIARYLLALAACRVGLLSLVARAELFKAPGILVADPRREAFYWVLDPGLPAAFEASALEQLAPEVRAAMLETAARGASSAPAGGGHRPEEPGARAASG